MEWKGKIDPTSAEHGFKEWNVIQEGGGKENRCIIPDPQDRNNGMVMVQFEGGTFGSKAGSGFYAKPLPEVFNSRQTVTLTYEVCFPVGFQFAKGGKLPGLYGGHPGVSGGKHFADGFSCRLMFRAKGEGEAYLYVDPSLQTPEYARIPPKTTLNPEYGDSVGKGAFHFITGAWNTVSIQIRLNSLGQSDGELSIFHQDKRVIHHPNMIWRSMKHVGIEGIHFSCFFGGHDASWATPIGQEILFRNFSLTVQ